MKQDKTQFDKSIRRLIVVMIIILIVASPLFYHLTRLFYAEDMIDIIESVKQGRGIPPLDLERDIFIGMLLQYVFIFIALLLSVRVILSRDGEMFRRQKEFTENASHELQTPLAVVRSKIDLLIQQPHNSRSAALINDISTQISRMKHLNRSLLLLARIDNRQFNDTPNCHLDTILRTNLPTYQMLATNCQIEANISQTLTLKADENLVCSLLDNLVTNALRNTGQGTINITLANNALAVSNPSDGTALDANAIFRRFNQQTSRNGGNGLGLAIVRNICNLYHWRISYSHHDNRHIFKIRF